MRSASNVIEPGFALATTCIGGPLARRLEAAAAAGFSWIEFFWRNAAESGLSLREVGRISTAKPGCATRAAGLETPETGHLSRQSR
jgi:hypothetical protein